MRRYVRITGEAEGRGSDAVPRKQAMLRGIQMSQVQTQMDVGQQLGEYGPRMQQMSRKRLSAQAGDYDSSMVQRLRNALAGAPPPGRDRRNKSSPVKISQEPAVANYSRVIALPLIARAQKIPGRSMRRTGGKPAAEKFRERIFYNHSTAVALAVFLGRASE